MQFIESIYGGAPILAWVDGVPFEYEAQQQVQAMSSLPFVVHQAIMPDVHAGIGATVGTVIATRGAIIPAAVGVDIGCGMAAIRTSLKAADLPDTLSLLRSDIERAVPHGNGPGGNWREGVPNSAVTRFVNTGLEQRFSALCEKYPALSEQHTLTQFGSLGGGNHFIEICLDEDDRVWVMLHSGSRGIGNRIGTMFIKKAREMLMKRHGAAYVPDKDLAWFEVGEPEFDDYIEGMRWGQDFARQNREVMMDRVLGVMRKHFPGMQTDKTAVNCHHNFCEEEVHPLQSGFDSHGPLFEQEKVWVTRKGAVRATEGALGIIPGSMGARSYIVRGLGNASSLCSCSHGAGRVMSRSKAKASFSLEDIAEQTAGVECRKDIDVVDEIPAAYKSIDDVMAAQSDLISVVHTLKQVLCVKG